MHRILGPYHPGRVGMALLLIRLVTGVAFIFHGLPKVADTGAFASMMNLPPWLGAAAAWTEVIGGGLLALGLLTPVAALGITGVMLGAFGLVHLPKGDPFVNPGGASYELAAVYLAVAIGMLLAGPGAYSIDALLARGAAGAGRQAAPRERGLA